MQTVLSEMFNDMLNTPLQPLTFTEGGYYGRCDNCERIQNLIKVNNTKILCEKCHSILSLSDKLKILIRLNNKIIQKIKEEMSKLYININPTEDDMPNN